MNKLRKLYRFALSIGLCIGVLAGCAGAEYNSNRGGGSGGGIGGTGAEEECIDTGQPLPERCRQKKVRY